MDAFRQQDAPTLPSIVTMEAPAPPMPATRQQDAQQLR